MNAHARPAGKERAPSMRRGACPALSAPMRTGDGLLIRLSPVSGGLSPRQLIGLGESAARHGNGTIEVTARGSLQFRGFCALSAGRFAADVDALGIAVRTGVPVETSPLAGLDASETADPSPLADGIRARIADAGLAARLGPKVSVVVDGGGAISMAAVSADVRLTAGRQGAKVVWQVALGGDARTATRLGGQDATTAIGTAISMLTRIADFGPEARARDIIATAGCWNHSLGTSSLWPSSASPSPSPSRICSTPLPPPEGEDGRRDWDRPLPQAGNGFRITKLPYANTARCSKRPKTDLEESDNSRRPSSPSGGGRGVEGEARDGEGEDYARQGKATDPFSTIPLNTSQIAIPVALPFGHADAATLIHIARKAEALGIEEIRPAPDRRLLCICSSQANADTLKTGAVALGLITNASDNRARIAACAGAPACASGRIPTRPLAEKIAAALGPDFDPSISIHISGCEKGCARQSPASITAVGGENGVGLVVDGTARDAPGEYTAASGVVDVVARLAATFQDRR